MNAEGPKSLPIQRLVWLAPCAVVVAYWVIPSYPRTILRQHESRSWPAHPGEIVKSEVYGVRSSWDLEYKYEVEGREFVGSTYRFAFIDAGRQFGGNHWRAEKYLVGSRVPIYSDPRNPELSVIKPGYHWADFVISPVIVLVLLFAIGKAAFIVTVAIMRSPEGRTSPNSNA